MVLSGRRGREEHQVMILILVDRDGLAYLSAEINDVLYAVRWSHTPVRDCIDPKACLVEMIGFVIEGQSAVLSTSRDCTVSRVKQAGLDHCRREETRNTV